MGETEACPSLLRVKHTLAINSLLRNSPFTRVTFPFSSNSVHRNFNSLLGLIFRPPSPTLSSRKPGKGGKSSWSRFRLPALFGCGLRRRQKPSRLTGEMEKGRDEGGCRLWFAMEHARDDEDGVERGCWTGACVHAVV